MDSRRLATKHSRKALKASLTLGILLGMFFVTWLPFFLANIVQVNATVGGRPWEDPLVPSQPEGGGKVGSSFIPKVGWSYKWPALLQA